MFPFAPLFSSRFCAVFCRFCTLSCTLALLFSLESAHAFAHGIGHAIGHSLGFGHGHHHHQKRSYLQKGAAGAPVPREKQFYKLRLQKCPFMNTAAFTPQQWTVHGLWPSWAESCGSGANFVAPQDPALRDRMNKVWPSFGGRGDQKQVLGCLVFFPFSFLAGAVTRNRCLVV